MIRRFCTMTVFVTTIGMAAFGQHIFGRNDLIALGHQVQAEAPKRTAEMWHKTDMMLAQLSPEAGMSENDICSFENLAWASTFHKGIIRS